MQQKKEDQTVVLFYDGAKEFLKESNYNVTRALALARKRGEFLVKIGGGDHAIKDIKAVYSIKEFYAKYPENRPMEYKDAEGLGMFEIVKKVDDEKGIKSMIAGLKGYMNSSRYKGTKEPQELLKHMEKTLDLIRYKKANAE